MILGIGTDLCDIDRIVDAVERHGQRFFDRIFTEAEYAAGTARRTPSFWARRFAAKEACAKALGCGITDRVRWRDIEILNGANGEPKIYLKEGALELLSRLTPKGHDAVIHLSLSDDPPVSIAFVVIEVRPRP